MKGNRGPRGWRLGPQSGASWAPRNQGPHLGGLARPRPRSRAALPGPCLARAPCGRPQGLAGLRSAPGRPRSDLGSFFSFCFLPGGPGGRRRLAAPGNMSVEASRGVRMPAHPLHPPGCPPGLATHPRQAPRPQPGGNTQLRPPLPHAARRPARPRAPLGPRRHCPRRRGPSSCPSGSSSWGGRQLSRAAGWAARRVPPTPHTCVPRAVPACAARSGPAGPAAGP